MRTAVPHLKSVTCSYLLMTSTASTCAQPTTDNRHNVARHKQDVRACVVVVG